MKRNTKLIIGVVVVLAVVVCIGGGKVVLDRSAASGEGEPKPQATQNVQVSNVPDGETGSRFAVPTPAPSGAQGTDGLKNNGEAAVTEDEDGTITIVPNWEAKAQYAQPVDNAPAPNMGGAGGGDMDLEDGVYHGDHPDEEPTATPAPSAAPSPTPVSTPAATPKPSDETGTKPSSKPQDTDEPPTLPTTAPSEPSGGGSTPPSYEGSYDGELSPDGNYGWFKGFGWVERGEGSYGIPSKGTHTEDGRDVIGEM